MHSLKSPRSGRDIKSFPTRSPSARGAAAYTHTSRSEGEEDENEDKVSRGRDEAQPRVSSHELNYRLTRRRKRVHLVGPRAHVWRASNGKASVR